MIRVNRTTVWRSVFIIPGGNNLLGHCIVKDSTDDMTYMERNTDGEGNYMKLLIVDDEPIVRRGIKMLVNLEALGITELFEAKNGEEALGLFKENKPELVLLDINMPGMNGLTLASKIKEISSTAKIAMITGYDYFDYAREALRIGVQDYILKPVSKDDITSVLEKLISSYKQQRKQEEVMSVVLELKEESSELLDESYKVKIKDLIDKELKNPDLSLSFLADELGLSSGYLSSLIKQVFGVSFKEYVLNLRLNQAKLLILSTSLKNYEISEAVGFSDANYFSTAFKKRFGKSPNQFKDGVIKS